MPKQLQLEKRGVRKCQRNSPADTKVSEEGEEGGAPDTGAEVPLQPLNVHNGTEIHLQPLGDPQQRKESCGHMGSPHQSRLLAGPVEGAAHTGAGGKYKDPSLRRKEHQRQYVMG